MFVKKLLKDSGANENNIVSFISNIMGTEVAISFSSLRAELENERSSLFKIDENIKKIVQTSGRFQNDRLVIKLYKLYTSVTLLLTYHRVFLKV